MLLPILASLLAAYLIGAIPFGWIVVKIATGRDIRSIESGRTGGTNAMRAAGTFAGIITAALDIAKGVVAVAVAREIMPVDFVYRTWVFVAASLLVIIGHNYSIYLAERHAVTGRLRLRGGAGGAATLGGAMGLWMPVVLYVLPLAALVWYFIGYASVTTMSIALFATLVFAVKASQGELPWVFAIYGLLAEIIVVWALRPNLKRLVQGTERIHGFRVWLKKRMGR